MKRIVLVFLLLVFIACPLLEAGNKSDKLQPKWLTHSLPESASGTYTFIRAHGTGSSIAGAKQSAFVAMSQKLEIERGLTINTNVSISEKTTQSQHSTRTTFQQEITLDVSENGRQMKIVCREIDDYWEYKRGEYHIDVLYTVTNTNAYGGSYDDEISVTANYGATGFLSIVPGLGQIVKGSKAKGCLIIAGEIAAAGGILLFENNRASYIKKMIEQPKYASQYNSLANESETARNICIGTAAAIYVYNLIDAFAVTGAKRVVVRSKSYNLSLQPYADINSVGLGLALKF